MNYLNPTFSIGPAAKLDGIACEACVFRRGEHAKDCPGERGLTIKFTQHFTPDGERAGSRFDIVRDRIFGT